MDDKELAAARGRVRRLRDLYMHAAIYAVVMGGLALFNWVVSPAFWWVAFPAIAMGRRAGCPRDLGPVRGLALQRELGRAEDARAPGTATQATRLADPLVEGVIGRRCAVPG